ncbi:MAG TPA: hypothetical protein VIS07_16155 [Candidatus Binatia bacterium]
MPVSLAAPRRRARTLLLVATPWLAMSILVASCTPEPPANAYSAEVVENFQAGCRRGASEAVCNCALRRIQQKWTEEEFRSLEARLGDEAAAREIAETVAVCAGR